MNIAKKIQESRTIGVFGKGRSGQAAVKFLKHLGHTNVLWVDDADTFDPDPVDLWIVSPGVDALKHPILSKYLDRICGEVDLGLAFLDQEWVAVTGTNGKSTVTHMIAFLKKGAVACGNFGKPLTEAIIESHAFYVVELSSYQLERIHLPLRKARVGILTQIQPDHLERHQNFAAYCQAKWKMISHLLKDQRPLLVGDPQTPLPEGLVARAPKPIEPLKNPVFSLAHNRINAALALEAMKLLGEPCPAAALEPYPGLEHRLEPVLVNHQQRALIYNDSKATNLDSLKAALTSGLTPDILIVGGASKKENFGELAGLLQKVPEIWVYGSYGPEIMTQLTGHSALFLFKDLEDLFKKQNDLIRKNFSNQKILLFSPGCPSFDHFKDFEERGAFFKRKVGEVFASA